MLSTVRFVGWVDSSLFNPFFWSDSTTTPETRIPYAAPRVLFSLQLWSPLPREKLSAQSLPFFRASESNASVRCTSSRGCRLLPSCLVPAAALAAFPGLYSSKPERDCLSRAPSPAPPPGTRCVVFLLLMDTLDEINGPPPVGSLKFVSPPLSYFVANIPLFGPEGFRCVTLIKDRITLFTLEALLTRYILLASYLFSCFSNYPLEIVPTLLLLLAGSPASQGCVGL